MPNSSVSPLAVVPFNKDVLIDFVRHKTGWNQRSEVSNKDQLTYLYNYLSDSHIDAKTILLEEEYIDRHYLEDYSEYYARCFATHPRKCSRVHFFSNEFEEHKFTSALAENESIFLQHLKDSYLGFVVIRPIPHTFLAKVCLKWYPELGQNPNCKLIKKKNKVSLFGLPLEVESAPFLEQDKVVSACATSALWMMFSSSNHEFNGGLPSPSAITKSAIGVASEVSRTFPNSGLSIEQVIRSLKFFGLEPLPMGCENASDVKERCYSYLGHGLPVLLGGSIYRKNDADTFDHKGKHFVCVMGYKLEDSSLLDDDFMRFTSHSIEKLYVNDDRYGPYIRVSTLEQDIVVNDPEKGMQTLKGLVFSLRDIGDDFFVPDVAIVGLYHKIRLTYLEIKNMCSALVEYLQESQNIFERALPTLEAKDEEQERIQSLLSSNEGFISGEYDIALITNAELKEELRLSDKFITFNGAASKISCLLQSMPKYIWRCRIWGCSAGAGKELFTDILFDATEIAQGQVLFAYISYDNKAEVIWKATEEAITSNSWQNVRLSEDAKKYFSGFLKFFGKKKDQSKLNTLYGPLGYPKRGLSDGEFDDHNNIQRRTDIWVIRAGSEGFWNELDFSQTYLWVIDENGDLVLGKKIEGDDGKMGHPTLIDGGLARLGGELFYKEANETWYINSRSRTYSSHIKYGTPLWENYLTIVANNNLKGRTVRIASTDKD